MKKIYLMCSFPGAGKSTWVNEEVMRLYNPLDYYNFKNFKDNNVSVCSADSFIYTDGIYKWSPQKAKKAHELCREKYIKALYDNNVFYIFVDNTNLNIKDIRYYYDRAMEFSSDFNFNPIEFEIVKIHCKPEVAFKRQTHWVPLNQFSNMVNKFNNLKIPEGWNIKLNHIDTNDYNEQAG